MNKTEGNKPQLKRLFKNENLAEQNQGPTPLKIPRTCESVSNEQISSNPPQVEVASSSNQPQVEVASSSNQPQVDVASSSNQPQVEVASSSNQPQVEVASSSNQPKVEVASSSNQRPLELAQLNKNKEQSRSTKGKKSYSRKDKQSLKHDTEHGNEYQRIIQILLRHRGFKIADFKLGTEVKKVGDLDDIVCCIGNTCRFIQVKHEKEDMKSPQDVKTTLGTKSPGRKSSTVVLHRLFETNKNVKKAQFEIVQYFNSFCKIKEHETFGKAEITEINIVTNRPLRQETGRKSNKNTNEKDQQFQKFLVLRDDFESDQFLYLGKKSGKKYSLNVDALKGHEKFMECLKNEYDEFHTSRGNQSNSGNAEEFINQFLEKVYIVVNYPTISEIKKIVFQEICIEHGLHMEDCSLIVNSITHREIEHLMSREDNNEFLLNEDWKKVIDELKQFSETLKETGIATYKTENLLNRHSSIMFESDRIRDMYEDILTFITHDEKYIFHCNNVQNEKLVAIKTLNIINQIKEDGNEKFSLRENVSYADLHSLIREKILVEQFLTGVINTLIITVGSNQSDDNSAEDLANKMVNGLNKRNQKVIIISTSNNIFSDKVKVLSENQFSEKSYNHNFSCLSQKSKEEILSKQVLFQGKMIQFGSLFSNNINFANNIIDENVMLKISDNEETLCLLDTSAFESPGYNEKYYISRKIIQKTVQFDVVKEMMQEELFFLTPTNGMRHSKLKTLLVAKGINEKYIQELPKKPRKGKRKIEKNGIILKGLANESNDNIFKEIAERNIIVHWLLVCDSNLFHVDSKLKLKDDEALLTTPTDTSEMLLSQSLSNEKILILAGDSGVGKSTVLTCIANNILKQLHDMPVWIIKVNLRTFYRKKTLKKIGDLTERSRTVDLISDMGSLSDSSNIIAKKIIEEGLKKYHKDNFNMVLLLDGFNEISPSYQEQTCSLIKTLSSECNLKQVWITTQMQGKVKLENKLEVPAYVLGNLDGQSQISLMVKYWTTKYSSNDPPTNYDSETLKEDAKRALKTWKESMNEKDEHSFTQVSLNLIILSDVLLTNDRQMFRYIDLCSMYETFICKKFSLYNEEISEAHRHLTEVEQIKEKMFEYSIKEILQELSVNIILTTYQKNKVTEKLINNMTALSRFKHFVEDLQKNDIEVTYQTILSKIGFLSVKDEIDFTHDSFAQYFFSDYLVNNLNDKTLKTFFVKHVLSESHLYLCRKFLNNSLKKQYGGDLENMFKRLKRSISALPKTKIGTNVKTWAVSKVAEDKLDHVIILLMHVIGSQYSSFLGQWVRNEVSFCAENEELVKKVFICLFKEEKARVPCKLRMILKINKSHNDKDTKLEHILDDKWFIGDDRSQDEKFKLLKD